ncbi:serine dehydratase subunit alpha family protein [Sporomusa aerivorans]|uniref:L-cysteine desulfidase family protein n=1 Tax=Sporomusa aerivorans TaxID=204936 RepID=UPI00352A4513
MKHYQEVIGLIRAGVIPALGCTEPGAVALAAAYAKQAFGDMDIAEGQITVSVDPNVYKNGLAVGVPGTGQAGLAIAAALGFLIGDPGQELSLLSGITPGLLEQAKVMTQTGKVSILLNDKQGLYIEVIAKAGDTTARSVIAGNHTKLVSLQFNGTDIISAADNIASTARSKFCGDDVSLGELINAVEAAPYAELVFLEECVSMNLAAAAAGLTGRLGMAVGAHLQDLISENVLANDLVHYAKILTAAGADARMSGETIPVMSVAGSGNHGLTATLPVVAVGERMNISREKTIRALAVSAAVTLYIKNFTGSLSALCGCAVAAATGASAAIVWMLDGTTEQINGTIKNMIANLTGMICDGGKVGCALKLATAAGVAVETALLTLKNVVVPCSNGIILQSTDATIRNLGLVSNPGMVHTDKIILDIMLEKSKVFLNPDL